jgi:acetate---CoA ligase (ADP-forming) subunit beta
MAKLSQEKTEALLKRFGIPFPKRIPARNEDQAVLCAKKLGYPVVLKVSSPDIIHKTDAGGILLNLEDEEEVRRGYRSIMKSARKYNKKARINGVDVFKMIPKGTELIVGLKKDPQFGPVIMFGLGGIFVEVLEDVSFRLAPITRKDAREMMREIKGYRILEGIRGEKPANVKAIEDTLLRFSELVMKKPDIKELDINPLFAYDNKVVAGDVRIIV